MNDVYELFKNPNDGLDSAPPIENSQGISNNFFYG